MVVDGALIGRPAPLHRPSGGPPPPHSQGRTACRPARTACRNSRRGRDRAREAGATGPQRLRSAASNAALNSPALQRPAPTSTSVPTIERTCRCRNDSALASKRTSSPSRLTSSRSSVRIGDFAWHCESRKVEKSCRPMSTRAAACIASASRRGFNRQARPRSKRERRAAIDDAIEIVAGGRAVPRVEIGAHALGAEHRHGMGMKQRVEPLAEPERVPVALKVDMRDLAPRMHAGVGAPGAMGGRARAGHREHGALQHLLNRKAVLLPLPADERRAVIFEDKLKARHSKPGRTRGGERRRWLRREPRRRGARRSGRH